MVLCLGSEFQAGSEQVSRKSGAESGLRLPAHLLSICAHLEQLRKDLQELQSSPDCSRGNQADQRSTVVFLSKFYLV